MANAINWFEIPASNFERAVNFYAQVLGAELPEQNVMGSQMAFLPADEGSVAGAICHGEMYTPSDKGALIYLNGGEDLSTPLARVDGAGGQVVMPKTKISEEVGYMAIIMDTEGNRIAFHSMN